MTILVERFDDICSCKYVATREVKDGVVIITLSVQFGDKPPVDKGLIKCRDIQPEYHADLISWYNVLFCSNSYGSAPDYSYMNYAVQNGKKPAATVYLSNEYTKEQIIQSIPENCDWREYGGNMLWVFRKGCLADFFDLSIIQKSYAAHNVTGIDWELVRELFTKPLEFFAEPDGENGWQCGFNIQSGGIGGQTVITGLLLGYPIESTIAWLKGDNIFT